MADNALNYAGHTPRRDPRIRWTLISLAVWAASIAAVTVATLKLCTWPLLALMPFKPVVGLAFGVVALLGRRGAGSDPSHFGNLARVAVWLNLSTLVLVLTVRLLGHVGP